MNTNLIHSLNIYRSSNSLYQVTWICGSNSPYWFILEFYYGKGKLGKLSFLISWKWYRAQCVSNFIAEYVYFHYRLTSDRARTMRLYFSVANSALRVNVTAYMLYMISRGIYIPLKAQLWTPLFSVSLLVLG